MRTLLSKSVIFALLAAALAGCAGNSGDYPSLAMRPFESGTAPATAAPPPPPAPIRPVVSPERLADLLAGTAAAHDAFLAQETKAAQLARAATGQPFASAAHAAALVALADLDAQRGKTAGTLATVDGLAAEARAALADDAALVSAQSEIAAPLAREDAAIARLWEMM